MVGELELSANIMAFFITLHYRSKFTSFQVLTKTTVLGVKKKSSGFQLFPSFIVFYSDTEEFSQELGAASVSAWCCLLNQTDVMFIKTIY